jgi:hypothetical protein
VTGGGTGAVTGGGTGAVTGGGTGAVTGGGTGAVTGGGTGAVTGGGTGTTGGGTACSTTELLVNGSFDATPAGTGWGDEPVYSNTPVISNASGGASPQSGTYRAWLGGWISPGGSGTKVYDDVYQEVTVPSGTTALVLTGYWQVQSNEFGSSSFDFGAIGLFQLDGGVISIGANLDNTDDGTSWTTFTTTSTTNYSGQTIQVIAVSENDSSLSTSFFFDTLSLKATHCP